MRVAVCVYVCGFGSFLSYGVVVVLHSDHKAGEGRTSMDALQIKRFDYNKLGFVVVLLLLLPLPCR